MAGMRRAAAFGAVLVVVLAPACAPALRPPALRLDRISVEKARLRGLGLAVSFRVRNPNRDPILIEGFEYELLLNGVRLGRGYDPEVVALGGFDEDLIVSRFDLDWLSLPASVRAILEDERAHAFVHGTFHVRQGARRARSVTFDSDAYVSLRR